MPISSGSQPAAAQATKRPSGSSPRFSASLASIRTTAAAPSDSWEALPAVVYLLGPLTGWEFDKTPRGVSGRFHLFRAGAWFAAPSSVASLLDHLLLGFIRPGLAFD